MFKCVPLKSLSEGLVFAAAVHDESLRQLLGPGTRVTAEVIRSLSDRGVRTVVLEETDWARHFGFRATGTSAEALPQRTHQASQLHTAASRELDAAATALDSSVIRPSANPFSAKVRSPGAVRYDRDVIDRVVEHHDQTVDHVRNLLEALSNDRPGETEVIEEVTTKSLVRAAEDLDLFVCMGINPVAGDSVFTHSTNVASLAIAVGTKLGLDVRSLHELGVGCLIQNAGMLKIDARMYESQHVLSELDFIEIAKHPIISTDLLQKCAKSVPLGVRMIVYQIHERCDGSGYARGITDDKIHPLAKIAAVADAYVALVSPRPHRPAMLPYQAMVKMLADVKAGLYDATAVRALLHTVSLFPIGSFVELSNSMIGKTIRANGTAYDRPILEVWNREHLTAAPQLINLAEQSDLKVVRPLTSPV